MVHVDGERGRGRCSSESRLALGGLLQRCSRAAEVAGNEEAEVARIAQGVEIVGGERILRVVAARALVEHLEQVVGQNGSRV